MTKRIIPILIIIVMSVFAISLTRAETNRVEPAVSFTYGR